jgi:cyclohexanecarboxylate-CoA ligase
MPEFAAMLSEARIRECKARGSWSDRHIVDFADDAAARSPDKTAIIDSRGSCTFADLRRLSIRCACGLVALGLAPGDVISLQLPNWREFTILHLAATRIGAVTNPLVPIFRDRELAFMLNLAESRLLAIPARFRNYDHLALAQRLQPHVPSLSHVLVLGGEAAPGMLSWEQFIATPWEERVDAATLVPLRPSPDAVTELVFTSGTTGDPKGVLHTHNTLAAPVTAITEVLGLNADSVLHMTSTFGHQTGFLGGIRLPLQLGATVVYQDVWDPSVFLELIEKHRITISNGGPTFLQDMLHCPDLARRDLSSFRIFRCGGAPIPRVLIREAREKLPHMTVHSAWGQTENAFVTITRPGDPEDKVVETDGCPQRGMEIRTVDADDRLLAAGAEGRLQCRGAFLFVGYAKRPDLTAAAYDGDWFDTGDLGIIDAEGFVRITGRSRDIIIRGGENIPVAYVENVLYEDPRIADVAIVGFPDARLGEKACACVTLRPDTRYSFADMQAHLERKGVAKQYWPERLQIVAAMPRSAIGKIRKAELKAQLAAMPPAAFI